MEYKTTFKLSEDYFSECFDQSIRYGNSRRRVEYVIGSLVLAGGISLLVFSNLGSLPALVLIIMGLYELFNPRIKKIKWLKKQMDSGIANNFVDISINDAGIASKSPYNKNFMSWADIGKIIETPKGLLIRPKRGMHIYLQKKTIPEETVRFIMSKSI